MVEVGTDEVVRLTSIFWACLRDEGWLYKPATMEEALDLLLDESFMCDSSLLLIREYYQSLNRLFFCIICICYSIGFSTKSKAQHI